MKFAEMAAMLPAGAKVEELWGPLCGESLLGTIRNTIRQDAFPVPGTLTAKDLEDGTLVINACYTPVREVEVFYNYLGIDDAAPSREMLVLVPDIDRMARRTGCVRQCPLSHPFILRKPCRQKTPLLVPSRPCCLSMHLTDSRLKK